MADPCWKCGCDWPAKVTFVAIVDLLHRTCDRCGFDWWEKPMHLGPAPVPLEHTVDPEELARQLAALKQEGES